MGIPQLQPLIVSGALVRVVDISSTGMLVAQTDQE